MLGQTTSQPPPQKTPANIDADQVATNQQAVPVPYCFGRFRVGFTFIAPTYNKRSEKISATTGKDQSTTVGNNWFGDIAAIICCAGGLHPLDHIYRYIQNSVVVWEGDIDRDTDFYEPVTVDGYGAFRQYWGYLNQPVDDLVLTPLATTIPVGVDPRDTTTWPDGDWTARQP